MSYQLPEHLKGLSEHELAVSREHYGYNNISDSGKSGWFLLLLDILKEPMLLLLFAVSVIYFLVGDYAEAIFMVGAIVAVSAISFYQDNRSKQALSELEKLNEPLSSVVRNGQVLEIPTHEIAVGDLCIIEEGRMINADGVIVHSNDFSVNESSMTGESFSVFKSKDTEDNKVFKGTLVVSGLAVFKVTAIGSNTELGKISNSLQNIKESASPLQIQIKRFVSIMAIIGVVVFVMVCIYSYLQTGSIIDSLLAGLTLAMSVLPEEIPVAFTTFMALGAWKLMREGIIIKRSNVVETLGSTTVICSDKTGTITQNIMQLKYLYNYSNKKLYDETEFGETTLSELIAYAMWSSEPVPFNPMEITLHKAYEKYYPEDERKRYNLFHEYPLDGKPPMMTHLFENEEKKRIIAAKGAPEAIISVSDLDSNQKKELLDKVKELGSEGYRVLGVAKADFEGNDFPKKQQDFNFHFLGFTIFYDPPKAGIEKVFETINKAGIQLKVITGDNASTTREIARRAGIGAHTGLKEGAALEALSDKELETVAEETVLFTRMFPESKLRVVNALKARGEVVAMVGDGVNDAPALKAAHIGVAMGNKGTEIAKSAASLVIPDDDIGKLINGIAAGRRIYTNIKKAVQYIISIHIPIILTVSLPLFLGWIYPEIFTPVHVIFLELIMGPICSIVYENEPMEQNTMIEKPRKMTETFLNGKELRLSIIQGLVITLGVLFSYKWMVVRGGDERQTRAMVFTTLILANIFLSYANRSFHYNIWQTFRNKNRLLSLITLLTLILLFAILFIPKLSRFFHLAPLSFGQFATSVLIALISVLWIEIYKIVKRLKKG